MFITLLVTQVSVNAQDIPCRQAANANNINFIKSNLASEATFISDTNQVTISIAVHVIKDEYGNANYSKTALVNDGMTNLNKYFEPIGLQFIIKSTDTIDNYTYSYFSDDNMADELVVKYCDQNTLNLFLVDEVSQEDTNYFFGTAYMPNQTSRNLIILQKQYVAGNYLTHLAGHFFGLLHTHESAGGIEYVNETNCDSAGDFLCDTYADPDLAGLVSEACLFDSLRLDPNSEDYIPSVANIMSNSFDQCRCVFTQGQYRRMLFYYKKYRSYLQF